MRGEEVMSYSKPYPRHPLLKIPIGNCTLLLDVFPVFIPLVGITGHSDAPISRFFDSNTTLHELSDWLKNLLG